MIKIATFDFLGEFKEMGYDLFDYIFDFPESIQVDQVFIDSGYDSVYFVVNLGTLFFVIVGYLVILTIICMLLMFKCSEASWIQVKKKKLKRAFIWNSVLRLIIEGYFEIILALGIASIKTSFVSGSSIEE